MKPKGWNTGIVHLWALDPEKVYINLEKSFKTKMLKTAKQITKSWNNLAKAIGLKISSYYCASHIQSFKRGLCCKLSLIIKLCKFLESKEHYEFSLKNTEKHVSKIRKMEESVSKSGVTLTLETRKQNNPPNLLIAISNLLKKIGIEESEPKFIGEKITKSSKIGYLWRIGIYGKRNLEKFAKEVGFSLKYKRDKLKKTITSIKRYKFGQGKAILELLKIAKEIEKENKTITSIEIAKRLRRNKNHIGNYLRKMCKLKLIKRSKNSKPFGRGAYPAEYKVIV